MDELVRAMHTTALCRLSALARWAENVLSLYHSFLVVVWATPCIFVCVIPLGWLG
jgi:hypothetical protein